jgi:hypothetical protein
MMLLPVGARPLIRQRFAVGTWSSSGRYVNPAPTELAFRGSFQPIARKLQREPGGERNNATHWCSALIDFRTSDANGGPVGDNIVVPTGSFAGTYQVVSVKPFDEFAPLTHYEVSVIENNEANPADPLQSVTVAEIILQTCRTLIKASGFPVALTDAQVVVKEASPMPRPPLPYLAVLVDIFDQTIQATDSQQATWADLLAVTGGTDGDTYTVTWDTTNSVTYTRATSDTNADVAAALCSNLGATGVFETEQSGAVFTLTAVKGAPVVTKSGTGTMTLQTHALPATVQQGFRSASLTIEGYGDASRDWMQRARQYPASPDGLATQIAQGVAVAPAGDTVTVSTDLGTAYEPRYTCAFTLAYSLQSVAQTGLKATTILVGGSVTSSDGQPALPFTAIVEP